MSEYICKFENGRDGWYEQREEIVRCRDCKFFDTRKCKSQWPFCLDAYCWWGERKVDA